MPDIVTIYTRVPSHYADELPAIAAAIRTAAPEVEVVLDDPHRYRGAASPGARSSTWSCP